ncbi:MAG: hypothetical protein AABN95_24095 [Acidobacteriota bacterium]
MPLARTLTWPLPIPLPGFEPVSELSAVTVAGQPVVPLHLGQGAGILDRSLVPELAADEKVAVRYCSIIKPRIGNNDMTARQRQDLRAKLPATRRAVNIDSWTGTAVIENKPLKKQMPHLIIRSGIPEFPAVVACSMVLAVRRR